MLQRTLPAAFSAPCLPAKTKTLPSGGGWLHEIKHDGFRMLVRRDAAGVRLFTRNGQPRKPALPIPNTPSGGHYFFPRRRRVTSPISSTARR